MKFIKGNKEMKAASIALATLLALSSTAFAVEGSKRPVKPADKQITQEQTVDTTTTGSIKSDSGTAEKPRLGFDTNPFSFGSFH